MKQHTWVENTLQEAEDQVLSRKSSETPIPIEKIDKRPRLSISYIVLSERVQDIYKED